MSRLATRDERGFTLIELLVVVVVIGVLAVVVVLNLGGVASQATASACRSDVNTVETAIGAYHTEAGDTSPVSIALLTGGTNPFLQSWPSSPHYTLTLSAGVLYVQTPIDSSPVLASDANACAGAASGAPTTTAGALAPIGTDASSTGANTGTLEGGAIASGTGYFSGAGALSLPGTNGSYVRTTTSFPSPSNFSLSAWFKSTMSGGLMGFTNSQDASGSAYDRMIWLDATGHLVFGVWPYRASEVTSPLKYNDGRWHSVVATWGPSGQDLYVDGSLVSSTLSSAVYTYIGFWHIGFVKTAGWSNGPTNGYFTGSISDVAVYPNVLDATQVTSLARATTYSVESAAVLALHPTSYWPLDGP